MNLVPLRLGPGDDLRLALEAWMDQLQQRAGWVISGIGSLAVARIRLAGEDRITTLDGNLELLSLAGSLGPDGAHLHLAIADHQGVVTGGHLAAGSLVRTTAELLLAVLPDWQFSRELDPATGYRELQIRSLPGGDPRMGSGIGVLPNRPSPSGSRVGFWGPRRQASLHLQEHQPGQACANATGPIATQKFDDRERAGGDAQGPQAKTAQRLQTVGHGLGVHRQRGQWVGGVAGDASAKGWSSDSWERRLLRQRSEQ
jgi:predicted DNA-binding protein with PD1-like motif